MFTGIVEERGEVTAVENLTESMRLTVRGSMVSADTKTGDSIAVNGVCLTVTSIAGDTFSADVMNETLACSSLGSLDAGSLVNLERPVTLQSLLGGHLVQGHVDGVGRVIGRTPSDHWEIVEVSLPPEIARYVVHKGSITVEGVSLTVASLGDSSFSVSLIPTTLGLTTLGEKQVGDPLNLEVDVIAKYVEKLMLTGAAGADAVVRKSTETVSK